jgi:hypothetical protein
MAGGDGKGAGQFNLFFAPINTWRETRISTFKVNQFILYFNPAHVGK